MTLFFPSEQQKKNQLLDGDSVGAIFALGTKEYGGVQSQLPFGTEFITINENIKDLIILIHIAQASQK